MKLFSFSKQHFLNIGQNHAFKIKQTYSIMFRQFCKYNRDLPHLNVGTIGHVDHGKTSLTSAITKYLADVEKGTYVKYDQIDKTLEEKKRGITINATTIEYTTKKNHYAHIDCPGHHDYVKNMITGAAKMDGAVLVVSAADGVMPQTREHILLCRQIGVETIIVFLNKCDLVKDPELNELVEMEIKELLQKYQYDPEKIKFIRGSALACLQDTDKELGHGSIKKLLDTMDSEIKVPERDIDKPFLLSIDGMFNIAGRGCVATGTVEQGKCKIGDEMELVNYRRKPMKTTITGVEMFKKQLDYAQSGDNVGLLLRGVLVDDIQRGMLITKPGSCTVHRNCTAEVYVLTADEGGRKNPFLSGYKPQMFLRTADFAVKVTLPEAVKMVTPGDSVKLTFKLEFPISIKKGERFALRESGRTVAAGVITEVLPDTAEDIKEEEERASNRKKGGSASAGKK